MRDSPKESSTSLLDSVPMLELQSLIILTFARSPSLDHPKWDASSAKLRRAASSRAHLKWVERTPSSSLMTPTLISPLTARSGEPSAQQDNAARPQAAWWFKKA